MEFKLGEKKIGNNHPVYFIADLAANHDGDLNKAFDLIKAAKDSGADAAKFQHFNAKTIVSDFGFKNLGLKFSHQKTWKKSVFETYKDASLDLQWTKKLKDYSDKIGIEFCSTPYSYELTDHIDSYVNFYKIGSGDITWLELIEYIAKKKKPVILSSGASELEEVELAINAIKKHCSKIVIMQCNTNYTGDDQNNLNYINLNVLNNYKKKFPDCILGLSDHTTGDETVLGSIALGARVIEKHFTLNNDLIGPDHKFSMNPKSWATMVKKSKDLEKSLGDGLKRIEKNEIETIVVQRRAIRAKEDIFPNDIISDEKLDYLRPCPSNALNPSKKNEIIGKKVLKKILKGDLILWENLK